MAHTLDFYQGSTTLFDMASLTTTGLLTWSVDSYPSGQYSQDTLTFHLRGSSIDNLFENMVTLNRVLLAAEDNAARAKKNAAYTPIFLRFQAAGATNLVRSEVFGESLGKIQNVLNREAIFGKMVKDITFTVKRRPYFEESAAVALAGSPFTSTIGGLLNVASTDVRGDLPAPVKITVRSSLASQDRILAAIRSPATGTVANFLNRLEAEAYTTRRTTGSSVADVVVAVFYPSGGGTNGQRWTPDVTSEVMLLRWSITSNVIDQLGPMRVFAVVLDNKATANTKIRIKPFSFTGSTFKYGDWGDAPKFVGTVQYRVLVDCGIVQAGGVDTAGVAPTGIGYELWAQATATGAGNEFDIDCIYLFPVEDAGNESGYFSAALPAFLGTADQPDGVLDANDRVPQARLVDGSGNLVFAASDMRGGPLYAYPGRAAKLMVLTCTDSNKFPNYGVSLTVNVSTTPRYRLARGST